MECEINSYTSTDGDIAPSEVSNRSNAARVTTDTQIMSGNDIHENLFFRFLTMFAIFSDADGNEILFFNILLDSAAWITASRITTTSANAPFPSSLQASTFATGPTTCQPHSWRVANDRRVAG